MSTAIARRPVGRPKGSGSKYTPELAASICQRIASGEPLRQICRDINVGWVTVWDWQQERQEFAEAIARARISGYDAIAAECLEIADSSDGDERRDRLRVDTRLKLLAKWDPKRYGELTRIEVDDVTDRSAQIAEARKRAIGG